MADSALRSCSVTQDELADATLRLVGPGSSRARRTAALSGHLSESALETLARLLFLRHGLRPELQVGLHGASGLIGRADMLFRAEQLVVELDGFEHHRDPAAFRHDRRRQNAMLCAGFRVVRFTWDDVVNRPDSVIATVRQLLAAAT